MNRLIRFRRKFRFPQVEPTLNCNLQCGMCPSACVRLKPCSRILKRRMKRIYRRGASPSFIPAWEKWFVYPQVLWPVSAPRMPPCLPLNEQMPSWRLGGGHLALKRDTVKRKEVY